MESHPTSKASCLARASSRMGGRGRSRAVLRPLRCALVSVVVVLAVAAVANARTETLRWRHPDPSQVAGYRVHYGPSPGNYTNHKDVGLPAPNADGTYSYDMEVPDDAEVYVAVTAYDTENRESDYSNCQFRTPDPAGGGIDPASGGDNPAGGDTQSDSGKLGQPGKPYPDL